MADLGRTYDTNTIPPAQPFEVIPAGSYLAQLVDSEMRTVKSGGGSYLWLEFEILEGPYAHRKLWDRLNLNNPNQQAVDIAERQFSALCHAAGQLIVSDSVVLHGVVVLLTVRVRPAQEASAENGWKSFDASNEIRGYSPPTEGGRSAAAQASAWVPPAPTSSVAARERAPTQAPAQAPWKGRKA